MYLILLIRWKNGTLQKVKELIGDGGYLSGPTLIGLLNDISPGNYAGSIRQVDQSVTATPQPMEEP